MMPGLSASRVPLLDRSLCPFRDDLCRANRCPTCCTGGSLSPEDRQVRLSTLAESEVMDFSPEMREDFRRAAAALAEPSPPS